MGDVHPDYHFVAKNGAKIRNLKELHDTVKGMDNITFNHHVNDFNNDFHNWVRDVHNDKELASELLAAKTKKETVAALKRRLDGIRGDIKEPKPAEASAEVVKKEEKSTKKNAKKKRKAAKTKVEVIPKRPVTQDIPTKDETPDHHPMHRTKRAIGDFALGLVIGGIAGMIISKFII